MEMKVVFGSGDGNIVYEGRKEAGRTNNARQDVQAAAITETEKNSPANIK